MGTAQLEQALIDAMKGAMTLTDENDSDGSMECLRDETPTHPIEWLQIKTHQFNNSHANHIRIVLEDFLVEGLMYFGSDEVGDQNQYAMTPRNKNLSLSFNEMLANTWIEFVVKKEPTMDDKKGDASIWLRTDYIYMCEHEHFPLDIELVDNDHRYIVRTTVVKIDDYFHFKNLGIQTTN